MIRVVTICKKGDDAINTLQTKRVLLTGAKSPASLEVARLLDRAGHEVYTVDANYFNVCRFSNSVKKAFVAPAPSQDREGFIKTLLQIIETEKIELLIPVWEEVLYISKAIDRFPKSCTVFCSLFEIVNSLHNKNSFIDLQKKLGVEVPETYLIKGQSDIDQLPFAGRYILKASYSRGSQKVFRVVPGEKPTIDFDLDNPWIAQEWIDGEKYCTYAICHQGKILAHSIYPVCFTMDDRSSCVAFTACDHPAIFDWVTQFVSSLNYNGQIAFDFIETTEGKLYAIECNPRMTSGIHLFKPEDRIDLAFLNHVTETIFADPKNSKQIAPAMIMYGLKVGYSEGKFWEYLRKVLTTQDVIFSFKDMKPFLFEPIILVNYWLTSLFAHSTIPETFTKDFDWNG